MHNSHKFFSFRANVPFDIAFTQKYPVLLRENAFSAQEYVSDLTIPAVDCDISHSQDFLYTLFKTIILPAPPVFHSNWDKLTLILNL